MKKPKKFSDEQLEIVGGIAAYRAASVSDDFSTQTEEATLEAVGYCLQALGVDESVMIRVRELLGCPKGDE